MSFTQTWERLIAYVKYGEEENEGFYRRREQAKNVTFAVEHDETR